jgi:hypothetical protein
MAEPYAVRFMQYLRRLYSLKEGYAPELAEEFVPSVELSHFDEHETKRLRGMDVMSAGIVQSGAVGQVNEYVFQAAPGTIAVVHKLALQSDGTGAVVNWTAGWERAAFSTLANAPAMDGRAHNLQITPAVPSIRQFGFVASSVAAPPVFPFPIFDFFSGLLTWFDVQWILFGGFASPGQAPATVQSWRIRLRSNTNNMTTHVSFQGYERSIEPSEVF